MTAMGLLVLTANGKSQISATGCGIVSEYEARMAPAAAVESGIVMALEPLPFGLAGLTRSSVLMGFPKIGTAGWISGRTSPAWTEITLGGRMRIPVGTGFAFGLSSALSLNMARSFSPEANLRIGLNAQAAFELWSCAMAIDEIAVVGAVARPSLRCGVMHNLDEHEIALDVRITADSRFSLLAVDHWRINDVLRLATSMSTAPFSMSFTTRWASASDLDVMAGLRIVEFLGIQPHVAIRWQW